MNRTDRFYINLNEKQKYAHDLLIRAINLNPGQSKTDGGSDVSRLQLLLGKGGAGKSHVLDAVITTLKQKHAFDNDDYLVMAPTGKVASAINGSTLHSHKHGLALPVRTPFRALQGEQLKYYQKR